MHAQTPARKNVTATMEMHIFVRRLSLLTFGTVVCLWCVWPRVLRCHKLIKSHTEAFVTIVFNIDGTSEFYWSPTWTCCSEKWGESTDNEEALSIVECLFSVLTFCLYLHINKVMQLFFAVIDLTLWYKPYNIYSKPGGPLLYSRPLNVLLICVWSCSELY